MTAARTRRAIAAAVTAAKSRGLNVTTGDLAAILAAAAPHLEGRRHGDHAGFRQHERHGEDPWACEECAEGERAYRKRLAAKRHATTTDRKDAA